MDAMLVMFAQNCPLGSSYHVRCDCAMHAHVRTQVCVNSSCSKSMQEIDLQASLYAGQPKGIPDEIFVAIETLLPTGTGKFLELWAARNVQRAGWTHVVETSVKYSK